MNRTARSAPTSHASPASLTSVTAPSARRLAAPSFLAACLVLTALPTLSHAADLPARKTGLWETTTEMPDTGGMTMTARQCIDAKTDQEVQRKSLESQPGTKCDMRNVKSGAGGYEAEYSCKDPKQGGTMHGRIKVAGDMNSQYTMTNTMRMDPPQAGRAEMSMTMKARHLGACPADMKPGEIRMPGMSGMPSMPSGPAGQGGGMTPEQIQKMMEQMKKQGGAAR
jgi:hypothetical protein